MRTGFELILEQKQTLTLTPELIQAIRILQYNAQELNVFIDEQLMANPMLDIQPEETAQGNTEDQDPEKRDHENAEEKRREDFDWQEYLQQMDYSDVSYGSEYTPVSGAKSLYNQENVNFGTQGAPDSQDVTLVEHLMFQLQFIKLGAETMSATRFIIESLDENGYLTQTPHEISEALGIDIRKVSRALEVVKSFDPTGVGASNLAECLILQLREKGDIDPVIEQIIENELENLAANRLQLIARHYGIKPEKIKLIADEIRELDPKPGRVFSDGIEPDYVIPDVIVEKYGNDYMITLNDASSPRLIISSYYRRLLAGGGGDPKVSQFLAGRLDAAQWLIKSIEHRKQTIYNVVCAVIKFQKEFLDHGRKHLRPLTLRMIADEIGIHESTVSRAVNGKYIQTPRGVFELRYFITSGVASDEPGGVAADGVKARISELISGEDKSSPLSDKSISKRLISEGIDISRRTVAKYRDDMRVPSSTMRRR